MLVFRLVWYALRPADSPELWDLTVSQFARVRPHF
jgi:hypothetical protein